jgi:hypothetical protein
VDRRHVRSTALPAALPAAATLPLNPNIDAGLLEELTALGYTAKPPPQLGTAQAFDWVSDCLLWLAQR